MRKFLVVLLFFMMYCGSVYAYSAQSYILTDASSGRVLVQHNADEKRGMASTTKIMTAIIAIENGNLSDTVIVSKNAAGVEGSSMWLKEGEEVTLEALLYGLMLNSGNDAAVAIAEHIGGNVDGFCQMMNDKAKELMLINTSFENPHGLDDVNHYTTARELAYLTCYALKNDVFNKIVNTKSINIGGRILSNHNKLLSLYDKANGVKTGYTKKCGRCLVTSASNDDLRLVAVTLNAPDDWNDHISLYQYGFSNYKCFTAINSGSYIKTVAVNEGQTNAVGTVIKNTLSIALKDGETPKIVYDIPKSLNAPISINQSIGTAWLEIDGNGYLKSQILASTGVAKSVKTTVTDILVYITYELLSFFKFV